MNHLPVPLVPPGRVIGLFPEIYDDFTAVDGTSIDGRQSLTGQVWEGANDVTYDPAKIQGNAVEGYTTSAYSRISLQSGTIVNAGIRLSTRDLGVGTSDQAFVFLIGPELTSPGESLDGKAFIHASYRPSFFGNTLAHILNVDVTVDGVGGLDSVFTETGNGPGVGSSCVFELQLDGDLLTIVYPGGRKVIQDSRFLQCYGKHVWIESFNFDATPRYIISIDEFWANTPHPIAANAQPYSSIFSDLEKGVVKLDVGTGAGDLGLIFKGFSIGTGVGAELFGGSIEGLSLWSGGNKVVLFLNTTSFFNGIVQATTFYATAMPTSDPGQAGAQWCDTAADRVIKLSAG